MAELKKVVKAKGKTAGKVTAAKKSKVVKEKKPTALQVQQLHDLVTVTKERHWPLVKFLPELKKLGVVELETCIHCAKSWFTWSDGAVLVHAYKSFKPYRVPAEVKKDKAAPLLAYAQKDPMDYLQLFTYMADAGAHMLQADLKTGKVSFNHFTKEGVKKVVCAFKVNLQAKSLKHPHYDELLATFGKSGDENWPHSKLYGALSKLGLDAYDFDFGPRLTTMFWSDGTKDFHDESANVTKKLTVAPKLDKKKLSSLVKDFKANKVDYPSFLEQLSKAGVQRYTTSVVSEKITYQGKDLKNKVEEKIELE